MMRYAAVTLGMAVLAVCAGCGGGGGDDSGDGSMSPPPPPPGKTGGLLESCPPFVSAPSDAGTLANAIDTLVAKEMSQQGLPGMTVEFAKNGTVLYAKAYGYADLSTCRLAQLDTPYQIGSVTKQFTAAAILQLESAGSLHLDDPVVSYLPNYSFDPRITLRMLLNHTSGLVDYTTMPSLDWLNGVAEATMLTTIAQQPLQFEPGSAFQYSSSNYFLLGSVIEVVTSLPYAQYLADNVLAPAGLTHTTYELEPTGAAKPYSWDNPADAAATGLADGIILPPSVAFSAGALWSTVQDLATWDAALLSGRVVSQAAFTEMTTPPASVPAFGQPGSTSNYAMGWYVVASQGAQRRFVWHNGQTLAYTAANSLTPETGLSLVILTNVDIQAPAGVVPLGPFGNTLISAFCANSQSGTC